MQIVFLAIVIVRPSCLGLTIGDLNPAIVHTCRCSVETVELRSTVRCFARPAPPGKSQTGAEEYRRAEAEKQVRADRDRHHRGMKAAANAKPLQREHDEPEHQYRRDAEDEPAQPPSETNAEPRL